ncbi:MAG TPA: YraN family protein [Casimicrobiaceae bacterium]|nr:YraN family protein [Casimicrobiaceae bacterium]
MTSAGARAEALAADYLIRQGLAIVARNFRTRAGEIDLIARDGRMLVFVEVRLRSSRAYGGAAESITPRKRARLVAAASGYLASLRDEPPCRFDAILMDALDPGAIEWRRDVLAVD